MISFRALLWILFILNIASIFRWTVALILISVLPAETIHVQFKINCTHFLVTSVGVNKVYVVTFPVFYPSTPSCRWGLIILSIANFVTMPHCFQMIQKNGEEQTIRVSTPYKAPCWGRMMNEYPLSGVHSLKREQGNKQIISTPCGTLLWLK